MNASPIATRNREPAWDIIAAASVATSLVYVGAFVLTSLYWDSVRLDLVSNQARPMANGIFFVVAGSLAWILVAAALAAYAGMAGRRPEWVYGFGSIAALPGGSQWVTTVLGIALIPAALVGLQGWLHPWLWLAAATIWLGFAISSAAGRRHRRSRVKVVSPGESAATESEADWFDQIIGARGGTTPRRLCSFGGSVAGPEADISAPRPLQVALGGAVVPKPLVRAYAEVEQRIADQHALGVDADGNRVSVVDIPRGGGFVPLVSALAYSTVAYERKRVLFLCPDTATAAIAQKSLIERLSSDALWANTCSIENLSGSAGIAVGDVLGLDRIPHVVFATPADLDSVLRHTDSTGWNEFLRVLGLVVLTDTHAFVGPTGSHVAMLVRRLEMLCRRMRIEPHYVIECPGGADRRAFLSRLTGLDIGMDSIMSVPDLNPRTVEVWDLPEKGTAIEDGCEALVSAVEQNRSACLVLAGPDVSDGDIDFARQRVKAKLDELTPKTTASWEVSRSPETLEKRIGEFDLAAVIGCKPSWARIKHDYGMLGSIALKDSTPARLTVIAVDAVTAAFLEADVVEGNDPQLTFQLDNDAVVNLHLRAAIGSDSWLESELASLGDTELSLTTWRQQGLTSDTGVIDPLVRPARQNSYFSPKLDLDSTEEAQVSVYTHGNQRGTLVDLDATRAFSIAYPRALLVIGGERYEVESIKTLARGGARIIVEHSPAIERTTRPLYRAKIVPSARAAHEAQTIHGRLRIDRCSVSVSEEMYGFVRRETAGSPGTPTRNAFDEPIVGTPFDTQSISLTTLEDCSVFSVEAVHAVAHALRIASHLEVEFSDPQLGIAVVEGSSWIGPLTSLAIYDRAAGGLGLVRAIGSQLDTIVERARVLVQTCECDTKGCVLCIDNPYCSAGFAVSQLDKAGAGEMLDLISGVAMAT